jgi:hypothetical protein
MAESQDPAARRGVVEALRRLATSQHPDIRYDGIEILAALPADESAPNAGLAVGWLSRDAPIYPLLAPEHLLKKLAEGRQRDAALLVARALLKIWDDNGQVASLYDGFTYGYNLDSTVAILTDACGEHALRLFLELLEQADQIRDVSRYRHYSSQPIVDDQRAKTDIYEALLSAVRRSAEIVIRVDGSHLCSTVQLLETQSSKILVRVALHVLAQNPSAAPDIANAYLLDSELIESTWCRPE